MFFASTDFRASLENETEAGEWMRQPLVPLPLRSRNSGSGFGKDLGPAGEFASHRLKMGVDDPGQEHLLASWGLAPEVARESSQCRAGNYPTLPRQPGP